VPVATVVVPVKAEEGERFPSNPQVGAEGKIFWEILGGVESYWEIGNG